MKHRHVQNGELIVMPTRTHKFQCCDCGLVHVIRFRAKGSKLTFRAWRDERATAQVRRWKK